MLVPMELRMTNGMVGGYTSRGQVRLTRRTLLRGAGAIVGLNLPGVGTRQVLARRESMVASELASVALPPDVGQTDLQVYVPATGHTLRGSFLDYWRANGAASVYGNPISEPFAADGYYSQAFENVVLQYRPEFFDTHDPIMRPMSIGQLADGQQTRLSRIGSQRAEKRYDDASQPRDRTDPTVSRVRDAGGVYTESTGHTIGGAILDWYTFHEGEFYLGAPLTEPYDERGATVQYFEGGLLVADQNGVRLAPLAKELGSHLGIDTTPVKRGELPLYDEMLFWTTDSPNPVGDPYAPGPKWIEVSISQQTLWAYQGNTVISSTRVSTGLEPNGTEEGLFHVRLKYSKQDMQGFTDATGEVLGFGEARPGTIPYEVKDVPHVMYFNMEAEAFHGAYWHDNFGQPMSHGCINLPVVFADWLYGWTPLGTGVWIHE
jgi:hypothetical protein